MASDITAVSGPSSVFSRIKAFEAQSQIMDSNSSNSRKPSKLIIDSDGDHEEDWVSVPITAAAMTPTILTATLAPPLPSRKQNHTPASSVSSFHTVSLSSESVASIAIDPASDVHKEEDTGSLESEPYENVDSTTSLGSPGTVAKLTVDWNQLNMNQKRISPSSLQRPQSAAPTSSGKLKPAPPPPPRSASASFSSHVASPGPISASTSNGRRPPPPPPPSSNRTSSSTLASSDRSSILSITSNTSSTTSNSSHHGYPPYQTYKTKLPSPSLNKPTVPLKTPALKFPPSTSSSSHSSVASSSSTLTTGPDPSTSVLALARPTPVPSLARKRYEAVFDANLANLNIAAAANVVSTVTSSKPALLSPSDAMAIPRKGWRGLSIDLVTSDASKDGMVDNEKLKGTSYSKQRITGESELNRLPGFAVRTIWTKSRLSKDILGAIWLECDPFNTGSLDQEAFVKGMWRIDSELKREELERSGRAKRTRTGSLRSIGSVKSIGSIKRQSSTASTASTTSSSHSLRNVPSVGSLRRTPVPTPSMIPPIPQIPSPAPTAGMPATPKIISLPPPLPARKPTMGTGLGTGAGTGSKVDLGDDEVDLLL
ncbi:hypothetical protein DFJ43DRAFT_1065662 [Lentinula guzmanii]|uniref:EH domain-containing protein n=1 Tax=Lentinula guzmanii TaxID=2804957 RepID=A0AA38N1L2_9AGAR|nr:hypothetical protein DFJ43DRAFT_1065662 [Lentinula guzmanii]